MYFDRDQELEKECCINSGPERRLPVKASDRLGAKGGSKLAASRAKQFPLSSSPDHNGWPGRSMVLKDRKPDDAATEEVGSFDPRSCVVDLKLGSYFSCAVGRKCSHARYSMKAPDDVISLLREMVYSEMSPVQSGHSPIHGGTVAAA